MPAENIPGWSGIPSQMKGVFVGYPERDLIPENIKNNWSSNYIPK